MGKTRTSPPFPLGHGYRNNLKGFVHPDAASNSPSSEGAMWAVSPSWNTARSALVTRAC